MKLANCVIILVAYSLIFKNGLMKEINSSQIRILGNADIFANPEVKLYCESQ